MPSGSLILRTKLSTLSYWTGCWLGVKILELKQSGLVARSGDDRRQRLPGATQVALRLLTQLRRAAVATKLEAASDDARLRAAARQVALAGRRRWALRLPQATAPPLPAVPDQASPRLIPSKTTPATLSILYDHFTQVTDKRRRGWNRCNNLFRLRLRRTWSLAHKLCEKWLTLT